MSIYPDRIKQRFVAPTNTGQTRDANATGRSASFVCGCFVSLTLLIDEDRGIINEAKFSTNGCGYMIAAADVVCDDLRLKELAKLHGLRDPELMHAVENQLGEFPAERKHCAEVVFEALRLGMSAHRNHRIEEFRGEIALICTCFGVTEEAVVAAITDNDVKDVDDISRLCRAGSGCGSCRMLITELIDAQTVN